MLPKEQFEEMEHSEHYDAAITSLKYAIESDIIPRKQISFLHAQVNAILAIYKLLLEESEKGKFDLEKFMANMKNQQEHWMQVGE